MALRVVTDSSCDLPPDLARSLDITVVPCNIHFGQDAYRDGVDMLPEAFYKRLGGGTQPTTSQPSIESFIQEFKRIGSQGNEVLSVHLSSKLSATVRAAHLAKEQMGAGPPIAIVDSLQVSLGLGILAIEAARVGREGGSLKDAVSFLEREKGHVTSYVSVDTLEYLVKGGRASKVQGFLGSLLSIKPILAVKEDGEVHPFERVRTRKKVMDRLIELVGSAKRLRGVGVLHAVSPEDGEALAQACSVFFPREKIVVSEFSAVLGSHVGPRALGLVLWAIP